MNQTIIILDHMPPHPHQLPFHDPCNNTQIKGHFLLKLLEGGLWIPVEISSGGEKLSETVFQGHFVF
jgi:hypothetical protein